MTMNATETRAEIQTRINEMLRREVLVETNEGTFGAGDVRRAIEQVAIRSAEGAEYRIYETLAGDRRTEGANPQTAPGHARPMGRDEMSELRRDLAELRRQLKAAG